LYIFKKYDIDVPPTLSWYVENRRAVFDRIRDITGLPLGDQSLKKVILAVIHGGQYKNIIPASVQLLEDLSRALNASMQHLRGKADFTELWFTVFHDVEKTNKEGSFNALVWQRVEA
jgi:hypothetical protein